MQNLKDRGVPARVDHVKHSDGEVTVSFYQGLRRVGTALSLGCHWLASAFPFSLPMKVAWIIKTFPTLATWCS